MPPSAARAPIRVSGLVGEAKAASERAKDRMSEASVRRRGMGSPEPTPQEVTRCQAGHSAGLRV